MNYENMFEARSHLVLTPETFRAAYNKMVDEFGPYNLDVAEAWNQSAPAAVSAVPEIIINGMPGGAGRHVTLRMASEYYKNHPELAKYNNLPGAVKNLTPIQVAGVACMVEKVTGAVPEFDLHSAEDVRLMQKWAYVHCRAVTDPNTWDALRSLLGKEA